MTAEPAAQPTPTQVAEMANAGAGAAAPALERGASPDEVRQIVRDEMAAHRDTAKFELSDHHIGQIADGVITNLEQAGAFEQPTPPPAGTADAAAAAAAAAGVTPPAPAPEGQPPRKMTWADKFLKMGER